MAFDKNIWKPNKKQELFMSLPWTIFEAMIGGGAGSGKSDVLLVLPVARGLHMNPRFKQVFMRRTYPELKNEIVPRSRELYSKYGATFNKTDMAWTFPREDQFGGTGLSNAGATIFLGHCENEKDVHKYDSMEINIFAPDELTSYTEYIYIYIAFTRVRSSDPTLPACVRAGAMPGGIGHTFVNKRFVKPYPLGGKIIVGKGDVKRFYVHSTAADNPDGDPGYAARLDGIPSEAERKAKKFGDWESYQGQVFDEFRDKQYPDEPDNALHVVEPFEIPSWWPKLVIGDWGYAAMCYIGFYAISPNKRVYLYRELYWTKTKIADWGAEVKSFIDREHPRVIKFCQSAKQDRGTEHTVQQQIEDSIGHPIELTSNTPGSRVAGKMLIHEYLRWRPKPIIPVSEMPIYSEEQAMWVFRNKGPREYTAYLQLFEPPREENNLPKLQIFQCGADEHEGHPDCCPVMIESIKACNYDKPGKDNKPAEDVAEFEGDDPYDDLRYGLDSAERYFEEAKEEFERIQKEEDIVQQLMVTQDWTTFYRQMRSNETSAAIQVVSRYHGRRR